MKMPDINKFPAAIVPMEKRKGFVYCSNCKYCNVFCEETIVGWAGKVGLFGSCVRRAPTAGYTNDRSAYCAFPVVECSAGCFEGDELPEKVVVACKLAEK
jgi:hypothetical protein